MCENLAVTHTKNTLSEQPTDCQFLWWVACMYTARLQRVLRGTKMSYWPGRIELPTSRAGGLILADILQKGRGQVLWQENIFSQALSLTPAWLQDSNNYRNTFRQFAKLGLRILTTPDFQAANMWQHNAKGQGGGGQKN